jgi:hypothetical protein
MMILLSSGGIILPSTGAPNTGPRQRRRRRSLLGGFILHVLHALLPLALGCESVGDVLAVLM